MKPFHDVPVEPDTHIIDSIIIKIREYEALFQSWSWSGFLADSIVFRSVDVESLTDEELFLLVKNSGIIREDDRHTITRSDSGYVFVNVNFENYEDLLDLSLSK